MKEKDKESSINELTNKMEQGFRVLDTKIDDLAGMMANYSIDTQNRFDKIDQRFDGVDQRFGQMDKKIEDEVRSVRVDLSKKIEDEVRSVKAEISLGLREIKEEIERLDARIDRLLKQTTDDISVLIEEQEKIKLRLKKLELKNSHV